MTPATIASRRADACSLVAALGPILDALETIAQIRSNPSDSDVDAMLISQHIDRAACAADALGGAAIAFALAISDDRRQARTAAERAAERAST